MERAKLAISKIKIGRWKGQNWQMERSKLANEKIKIGGSKDQNWQMERSQSPGETSPVVSEQG